jgi:hypothetical protein
MMEGEVIKPTRPIKKSLIGLSLKPRFDRWYSAFLQNFKNLLWS